MANEKFVATHDVYILTEQLFSIPKCNNNNLRNIHIIIPCRRSFSVLVIISGISPIQTFACVFYSQSNFIGVYFLYSPRRQAFLIDFICVFIGCSLDSSFRYSPVFKLFLVNF